MSAVSKRSRVKRGAKRACYDQQAIYAILDEALVCHIGGIVDGYPVVQPNLHWRVDDKLYIHGSRKNALINAILAEQQTCITVTLLDGLVLAKSAFHHSVNYRSVMLYGAPREITDRAAKVYLLDALLEKCQRGRSRQARPASPAELTATVVIEIPLQEVAAKIRTGAPVDDVSDADWPAWRGVIPCALQWDAPISC